MKRMSQVRCGSGAGPLLIWRFQIYPWLTTHMSVHQSQDRLRDLSGSVCVCKGNTDMGYKSHRDIISVCVCLQTEWTAIV